jgi:hypothetical protein
MALYPWFGMDLGGFMVVSFVGEILDQRRSLALYSGISWCCHFPTEIGTDTFDTAIPFMDKASVITSQCLTM